MTPRERRAIESTLRSIGVSSALRACERLTGGCIHRVWRVRFDDRGPLVVKIASSEAWPMLEAEAIGLSALGATRTVTVPRVMHSALCDGLALLVMSEVVPPPQRVDHTCWRNFGEDLAALHQAALPGRRAHGFGFTGDNFIGSTPQPNGWCDDWVEFNRVHRLGHQITLARRRGLVDDDENKTFESVIHGLDRILPKRPQPSLLHGDLWAGNILPTISETGRLTGAVIDPAPSVGDALADIAMLDLFGGIAPECRQAWARCMRIDLDDPRSRACIAVYQLYHVLNHVNIFGRDYLQQALRLARLIVNEG